eukprot:297647_1
MAPMFGTVIVSLIVLSMGQTSGILGENVTISTTLGDIVGIGEDNYITFKSIPYTENIPIADYRFTESTIKTSHYENNVYDARHYRYACIQPFTPFLFFEQSEDCLTLNIFTPNIDINGTVSNQLLPVMVWIHGGGYVVGDSRNFEYNPINFIGNSGSNIILVTFNYRLGPLGFLSSKQLYNEDPNWPSYGGMNGVNDQIEALKWINKYISDFGGNPHQVTIFGESAGGLSVCYLMISPIVPKDLFRRGIIESGSCIGPWGPQPTEAGLGYSDQRLLAAGYTLNITQLRQVNATKFTLDVLGSSAAWVCAIDELVLDKLPTIVYNDIDRNIINGNELIIGFNSLDGTVGWPYYVGSHPQNAMQLNEYISHYIVNKTQVSLLENYYYPLSDFVEYENSSNASIVWYTINADTCVICPSLVQANSIARSNSDKLKTFVYYFRGGVYPFYSPHGSELSFIFDHSNETKQYSVPWSQSLAYGMSSAWSNYGLNGVPNVTDVFDNVNIEWKAFGNDENVMVFQSDDGIVVKPQFLKDYRNGVCEFWWRDVPKEKVIEICMDAATPQ